MIFIIKLSFVTFVKFGQMYSTLAFISSAKAQEIDKKLLEIGYTISQLVELAGLAIAQAIYHHYPPSMETYRKPIILIGITFIANN